MNHLEMNPLAALVALAAALSVAGSARGQAPAPLPPDPPNMFEMPLPAPVVAMASPSFNFITAETRSSRLVKGAPYRADAVSESTQVLMDGNKIVRRSVQRLARDGEGRTRIERLRADGSVESVIINDVVASKRYWLVPEKKRVIELSGGHGHISLHGPGVAPVPPVPPTPGVPPVPGAAPAPPAPPAPAAAMGAEEARTWAEEMRRWARDLAGRLRSDRESGEDVDTRVVHDENGTARVIVRQTRNVADPGSRTMDVDVVRIVEPGAELPDSATAAIAALAPLPLEAGPSGQGVTTALGSKEFDRVRADGMRTTWTIPAGKIGNEKPIEVVSERWYAPDLLLVVSSRYFDPRRGETTYRLNGLTRGEPESALFQAPADYEKRPSHKREERSGK
jgi:hypothetical protein